MSFNLVLHEGYDDSQYFELSEIPSEELEAMMMLNPSWSDHSPGCDFIKYVNSGF